MRKPLFVALTTGAALLVGGGVAVAMTGGPEQGTQTAATRTIPASPSPTARATVTRQQAEAIAVRRAGGGRVESTEREVEHGRLVWDVDVLRSGSEWDVDVDAATGQVVRAGVDHDDRADEGRGRDDDGARAGRDDRAFDDHDADDHADDDDHGGDDD